MQIHELTVQKRKDKKTIGRGGKRGTFSGRGSKGQKARSGGNMDPLFEGGRSSLTERMKKLRGFKSRNPKKNVVNLETLEKKFESGEVVSIETLLQKKLIAGSRAMNGVKILGRGEISKKLEIASGILVSETAKAAIEKAGGKINLAS